MDNLRPDDVAWLIALRVVAAALAVGVVPGALVTLAWKPRRDLTPLDVAGFGIAISFGLLHLITVAAVAAHTSPFVSLAVLVLVSLAALVVAVRSGVSIDRVPGEGLLAAILGVLAVFLYLQGSPLDSFEDQMHAAVAGHLAYLPAPRLDNLYIAPGIVYTYPFPSTHYAMGLIARLSGVDALFVYHKLRVLWGPAAILLVYLAAHEVFGTRAVALAAGITAAVLAASGGFAMVSGFPWGWGQLTPYSHASDVAMNVLLPALLLSAFAYLQASAARGRAFFLTAALLLVFSLTIVHVREVIQFAAYLGCFLIVAAAVRPFRPLFARAALLLAATVVTMGSCVSWQLRVTTETAAVVEGPRRELLRVLERTSWRDLLASPAPPLLSDFIQSVDPIYFGLIPFLLFAGPLTLVVYRRRPLVWLMSASTLGYLLVMTVPLLAIAFIYATYYEILFTPVRNVIFFVYVSTGALLYAAAALITRSGLRVVSPIAGLAAGVLAILAFLCVDKTERAFFLPLAAAYGLVLALVDWRTLSPTTSRRRLAIVAVVALAAVAAMLPGRAPVQRLARINVRWSATLPDAERRSLEQRFSLTHGEPTPDRTPEVNVFSYQLTDLSRANVGALVQHPDVADTHRINRARFTVPPQAPPADDEPLGVTYVTWLQFPGWLLTALAVTALGALGLLLPAVLTWRSPGDTIDEALAQPFRRVAPAFVLLVAPFVVLTANPMLSPLARKAMPPFGPAHTPRAMMAQTPCLDAAPLATTIVENILAGHAVTRPEAPSCPPSYAVMQWMRAHVPPDGVLAIDRWNAYLPMLYVPQQVDVFPSVEYAFVREKELFRDYYRFFDARVAASGVQPFFNSVETIDERRAFLTTLGITHVLVDPAYYEEMRRVLGPLSDLVRERYADGQWAVYEVLSRASSQASQ